MSYLLFPNQLRRAFYMGCAGEKVYGLRFLHRISRLGQNFDIPGQGSGVTGDVDDPPRGQAGHGGQGSGVTATAGRVQDDDPGMNAFF